MTTRVRSHVLEEKSVAFMRMAFPSSWVIHSYTTRDYGIDLQIEIFTPEGKTTGTRFYAQVKATDKSPIDDILALDRDHFDYWRSQGDPVILLRYYEATEGLQWAWMHTFYDRIRPTAASLNVAPHLLPWSKNETPGQIERFLAMRRDVSQGSISSPYVVELDGMLGFDHDLTLCASSMSADLGSDDFVFVRRNLGFGHFRVFFSTDTIHVQHTGIDGCEISSAGVGGNTRALGRRALLAVFLCACRLQRLQIARILAMARSSMLHEAAGEDIRPYFINSVISCLGIREAGRLLTPQMLQENVSDAARTEFVLCFMLANWVRNEGNAITDLLLEWNDTLIKSGRGQFLYNAGNALLNQHRWTEAARMFDAALEADPQYNERPWFWMDAGAAAVGKNDFPQALQFYETALCLEDTPACRWRLADVLLHCGQYENALLHLNVSLPELDECERDYAACLNAVCSDLVNRWRVCSQIREPIDAASEQLLRDAIDRPTLEKLLVSFSGIAQQDALDTACNFNAGVAFNRISAHRLSALRFLTCAVLDNSDSESWLNSIISICNADDLHMANHIGTAGAIALGHDFLPLLTGRDPLSEDIPELRSQAWLDVVAIWSESAQRLRRLKGERRTVRALSSDPEKGTDKDDS